jgi:hypothetical protein
MFGISWDFPSSDVTPEPNNSLTPTPNIDIVWANGMDGVALLAGINLVVYNLPGSLLNEFILINTNLVDSIQMLPVTLDRLPADLPAGLSFYDAVQINLFSQGKPVTALEAWDSLTMAFSLPVGMDPGKLVILYWDPTLNGGQGGWVRLQITLLKYLGNGKWAIDSSQLQLLQLALEKMSAQTHPGLNGALGSLAAITVNSGGLFVLAFEP